MTAERIMHTHARAITVRHVEAQPASGPRPAMPEHYVTELDGQPLCWIPASALAPLLAEAEARGAREALDQVRGDLRADALVRSYESGTYTAKEVFDIAARYTPDWVSRVGAEQAGGDRGDA